MAAARSKLLVAAASLAVAALGARLYARMSAGEVVRERRQALKMEEVESGDIGERSERIDGGHIDDLNGAELVVGEGR